VREIPCADYFSRRPSIYTYRYLARENVLRNVVTGGGSPGYALDLGEGSLRGEAISYIPGPSIFRSRNMSEY